MDYPILRRDLQPMAVLIEGRRMIRFQDPHHLADSGVAVDIGMLPFLQMLDGNHSLQDIQLMLMKRQNGRIVYLSEVEAFVQSLDQAGLLESDSFKQKMENLRNAFLCRSDREAIHAGKAYPSDPAELARFIEEGERKLLDRPQVRDGGTDGRAVTGILAPHIDIQVARESYVAAYRRLKGQSYDLVVVFGINHQAQEGLYCLSEKNYLTPFGEIRTDREAIRGLKQRAPSGSLSGNDFGHKMEHSIEFQAIFLHHYLGGSFSMVPVLCSGVHEFLFKGEDLFVDGRFQGMVKAMKDLIRERGNRVLLVAGVDLSHVGPKFGDPLPADDLLPQATAMESEWLSLISRGKPEQVFSKAMENRDRFHVCGLPAIFILSALLRKDHGILLRHETYDERPTQSAVNYASMIFTRGA